MNRSRPSIEKTPTTEEVEVLRMIESVALGEARPMGVSWPLFIQLAASSPDDDAPPTDRWLVFESNGACIMVVPVAGITPRWLTSSQEDREAFTRALQRTDVGHEGSAKSNAARAYRKHAPAISAYSH